MWFYDFTRGKFWRRWPVTCGTSYGVNPDFDPQFEAPKRMTTGSAGKNKQVNIPNIAGDDGENGRTVLDNLPSPEMLARIQVLGRHLQSTQRERDMAAESVLRAGIARISDEIAKQRRLMDS